MENDTKKFSMDIKKELQDYDFSRCIGKTADEAKEIIKKDIPGVYIRELQEDGIMTMDYCTGRVNLSLGGDQKVKSTFLG
jgi:hypothetical protein